MSASKRVETPRELAQLRDRVWAWRAARKRGARVPPALWTAAARLAAVHGVSRTSNLLGLSYHSLKERMEQLAKEQGRAGASPMFVELRSPIASGGCQVEFENHHGAKIRIQWSGTNSVDLSGLVRTWMEVQ